MAERIYLPPRDETSQGDIYENLPATHIEARPLRIARPFPRASGAQPQDELARQKYGVHREDGRPPAGGFRWRFDQSGEDILAHGYLYKAMVLSHDCEIENDPRHRTLAMIRPITDLQPEDQTRVFDFEVFSAFPLEAQEEEPRMERCFIDFRRLTTVRPEVLTASVRLASVTDELRKAVSERFWLYLFRPLEEESPG